MKHKCTGWAIVATMERPDGTWYDETITEIKNNRINSLLEVLDETEGKAIIWANYVYDINQIVKAIGKKYGGKPEGNDDHAYITWTNKKKNDSEASVKLPYVTRKERKGRL